MEILLQGGWPGFSVNTKQNYEVNTHNITYCDPPLTNKSIYIYKFRGWYRAQN